MKPGGAFALIFFVALRLAAQDVSVSGSSWVDPSDPPDKLPVTKISRPAYPERLNGSTEIGYVVVDSFIYAQGTDMAIQRISTNPLFIEALESGDWRFKPATRNGKPVNSIVRHAIIFNPACASAKGPDATPRLLSVVAPEAPRQRAGSNDKPAFLHVTATVDASGRVTKAVADAGAPEELGPLAEDAVRQWIFAPARKNGRPVAQAVRVPVAFLEPSNVNAQADAPPRVTYQERPVYPSEMEHAGLRGLVAVRFIVDIEGRVRNAFVISSTNPFFDQPAIDAVLKWRFEPGRQHGVPVKTRMEVPISFDFLGGGGNEVHGVEHVDQSKLPPELRYDLPPKVVDTVFAVYPFELLRDGAGGTAEVRFLVDPSGEVTQAIVIKATRPEFGQALLAMLDEWKFQPAMKEGKPTLAALNVEQEFSDFGGDVPVSDEAKDFLYELKKEKPAFCPIKDLDARPQLLSPRSPAFPSALVGKVAEGQAVVEFLIDHDGKVQLPRVVSATDPAFGYAAVQGVAAWRFAPPTSHGKPVVVRAQVPIGFHGPKLAPAAPPPPQN